MTSRDATVDFDDTDGTVDADGTNGVDGNDRPDGTGDADGTNDAIGADDNSGTDDASHQAAASGEIVDSLEHDRVRTNGVDLHCVTAGPPDGDLVVCLHGFPEFWYSWHEQLPALVDAGYRVVAPDLRGANRSDKPDGVHAYHLDELAGDVAGLIGAFDRERASLVAHDFGGLVAWQLAHERPELVDRLAVCNCPHLTIFGREILSSLEQLKKSWYVFYFQIPRLPQWALAYDDYQAVESVIRDNATVQIPDEDVERYKRAFDRKGARTALVNWYRSIFRSFAKTLITERSVPEMAIEVPTMLCWGEQEHALSIDVVDAHHEVVDDLRIERFPEASHWVQFDASEGLNEALIEFL